MFEIGVRAFFSAARKLRGVANSEKMHGQTFEVEAVFQKKKLDQENLIEDYWRLKKSLEEVLQQFDHSYLNDHPLIKNNNPTTEFLCQILAQEISAKNKKCRLARITIQDTPLTWCSYYPERKRSSRTKNKK